MRIPLVAGNWKMNTSVDEAEKLVLEMLDGLDRLDGVEKVLCPPFVSLVPLSMMLQGSSIKLGAQNMYFEAKGAYTGEISPLMLSGLCEFVILGHSERRWCFGETDEMISKKVKAALANGLKPILCVGERLEENEAGKTEEVINRQVTVALDGVGLNVPGGDIEKAERMSDNLVIAYEPVWAIGTGKAATGEQAAATIEFIRKALAGLWNRDTAEEIRIVYGGSVTGANIAEFASHREIDGALVGGASLKADEFVAIVEQTARIKGRDRTSRR
ncbi:MAG: triose-phosphate isomerase [Dehalococcoidia bacterium]|nr:triose-phosphate isomerase [Dehalococcoidia bacterium]